MLEWTVAPPQVGLSSDSTFKVTNCWGDVCGRAFLINVYCKTQILGWVNGWVLCQLCHRLSLFVEPVFVPVLGLCLWLTKALTPITLYLSLIGSTEVVPVLGQCHCSVSAKLPLVVLDLVVCFWNDTKDNDWNRNGLLRCSECFFAHCYVIARLLLAGSTKSKVPPCLWYSGS